MPPTEITPSFSFQRSRSLKTLGQRGWCRSSSAKACRGGGDKNGAEEFQKLIDHRGIVAADPAGALAHLQLARSYAIEGDTARAKSQYQHFFTLFQDADPDLPVLKQIQAEHGKVH